MIDDNLQSECQKGEIQNANLLYSNQKVGKEKFYKRVMSGEIHISPADEVKSVVELPQRWYEDLVETHSEKDREVT